MPTRKSPRTTSLKDTPAEEVKTKKTVAKNTPAEETKAKKSIVQKTPVEETKTKKTALKKTPTHAATTKSSAAKTRTPTSARDVRATRKVLIPRRKSPRLSSAVATKRTTFDTLMYPVHRASLQCCLTLQPTNPALNPPHPQRRSTSSKQRLRLRRRTASR